MSLIDLFRPRIVKAEGRRVEPLGEWSVIPREPVSADVVKANARARKRRYAEKRRKAA